MISLNDHLIPQQFTERFSRFNFLFQDFFSPNFLKKSNRPGDLCVQLKFERYMLQICKDIEQINNKL